MGCQLTLTPFIDKINIYTALLLFSFSTSCIFLNRVRGIILSVVFSLAAGGLFRLYVFSFLRGNVSYEQVHNQLSL